MNTRSLRIPRIASTAALFGLNLAVAVLAMPSARAADTITFNPGSPWTQTIGNISHNEYSHEYTVDAAAGKTLQINLITRNPNVYFIVKPADSRHPLIDTEKTGDTTWSTKIATDGAYTVRVYVEPDATPRGEISKYALQVGVL